VLKVLQVGKYYPPVRGGIENNVHLLSRGLAQRHQVTALVFNTSRETRREVREDVQVIRVGTFGKVLSTEISPSFVPWMRRLPADLVHLHTPNPLGELGAVLSHRRSALVVTHHSDVVRQRMLKFLYGPVRDAVLRRADRIIVYTARYMESSETLAPFKSKCAIIPHGLDLREFEPTPGVEARAAEIRRLHGDRIILFVGRLVYYKGVEILMQALRDLDAALLVVGDGPMRARFENQAREAGVAHRAFFLGELPHAEKVAMYRACAVFTLPATHRSEAFGQVQVEAQACGRPVVSTDIDSGVPFVNEHGVTGLVVPPADPEALRAALARLLQDRGLGDRMGEGGRRRAEREFSMETMLSRTFALYDEIAHERGLPAGRGEGTP